jgi:hypothetical protein
MFFNKKEFENAKKKERFCKCFTETAFFKITVKFTFNTRIRI